MFFTNKSKINLCFNDLIKIRVDYSGVDIFNQLLKNNGENRIIKEGDIVEMRLCEIVNPIFINAWKYSAPFEIQFDAHNLPYNSMFLDSYITKNTYEKFGFFKKLKGLFIKNCGKLKVGSVVTICHNTFGGVVKASVKELLQKGAVLTWKYKDLNITYFYSYEDIFAIGDNDHFKQ